MLLKIGIERPIVGSGIDAPRPEPIGALLVKRRKRAAIDVQVLFKLHVTSKVKLCRRLNCQLDWIGDIKRMRRNDRLFRLVRQTKLFIPLRECDPRERTIDRGLERLAHRQWRFGIVPADQINVWTSRLANFHITLARKSRGSESKAENRQFARSVDEPIPLGMVSFGCSATAGSVPAEQGARLATRRRTRASLSIYLIN